MRRLLTILASAALLLAPAGLAAQPAHANTPDVTVGSPCYEPAYGTGWIYWTVTNNTSTDIEATITNDTAAWPPTFTIPAGGSVVRETLGGYDVQVASGGVILASASVDPDAVTACGTERADFNLIIDCRPSPHQITLRIRNATDQARQYKLVKQRGEEMTGTALPGNTFITEDWVKPTDRWSVEIAGYKYVRLIGEPALCNAPPSTPTPTASNPPTPNPTTPPPPSTTAPAEPPTTAPAEPTSPPPGMNPAGNTSGLNSGPGALTVGIAALVVGLAIGFSAAMQFRRARRIR